MKKIALHNLQSVIFQHSAQPMHLPRKPKLPFESGAKLALGQCNGGCKRLRGMK